MDESATIPITAVARFHLHPFLLSLRNEASSMVDPPFPYPGPLRLLRSKMTVQHYRNSPPEGWEETMKRDMAMLDITRHLVQSVDVRREIGKSLTESYAMTYRADHLRQSIILLRGVFLSQPDDESRTAAFADLVTALRLQFTDCNDENFLGHMVHYAEEIRRRASTNSAEEAVEREFWRRVSEHDTDKHPSPGSQPVIYTMSSSDPDFEPILNLYVNSCYENFKTFSRSIDVSNAYHGRREWLDLEEARDPVQRGPKLILLVTHLYEMNHGSLHGYYLNLAVGYSREAASCAETGDAVHLEANIFLAELLYRRFQTTSYLEDLKEAIWAGGKVFSVTDPDSPEYMQNVNRLAPVQMLMAYAERTTSEEAKVVVEDTVHISKHIVMVCPENDPRKLLHGWHLGNLHHRCYLYGVPDAEQHLLDSLNILEALEKDSTGSQYRSRIIMTLATVLSCRFGKTGDDEHLTRALAFLHEPTSIRNKDPASHMLLGACLRLKYKKTKDIAMLEEAIAALTEALDLSKDSPLIKKQALAVLCAAYHALYARRKNWRDLQLAIKHGRDGLKLTSSRWVSAMLLSALSDTYQARFDAEETLDDISESIRLLLIAVQDGAHRFVPGYHITLARRLQTRHGYIHSQQDLQDALEHCQNAMRLVSETDPRYKEAFFEMTFIQADMFKMTGDEHLFESSVRSALKSLQSAEADHEFKVQLFDHLASMFFYKYERSKDVVDLQEAIKFRRQALEATPKDSIDYPGKLYNSAFTLWQHMVDFGGIHHRDTILFQLSTAVQPSTLTPLSKCRALKVLAVLSLVEEDYATSFERISAVVDLWPKVSPRAMTAYQQRLTLQEFHCVAQDAAAWGLLANQDCGKVLEVLEAGRGIISGWLINARNDVSRLQEHDPELASRYTLLRDLVSRGDREAHLGTYFSIDDASQSTERDQWREHLDELEEIEKTVRSKFPRLKDFQRPLSVVAMKQLASKAPIVEINTSPLRSDAFIVTASRVRTVNLPHETEQKMETIMNILFGSGRKGRSLPGARRDTNNRLRAELRWLYENVVSKIMEELLIRPTAGIPSQRLIWVSNGLASFCPLHAAGTFSDNKLECTSAHVVSSYIPSLKALQFARERPFTLELLGREEILVVPMPHTKDARDISATEEVENMVESFRNQPANSINVLQYPSRDQVLEGLKSSWLAHFACHGKASSADPSQSSLLLEDCIEPGKPDQLSVGDISAANHEQARLCFLSACSTAENTAEKLTDENMHIASAFQLSGFSHVIGTLWEADDRAAVNVAKVFYDELAHALRENGGKLDADDVVAFALHKAVKLLKETKRPGSRLAPQTDVLAWAPFIHLGP